MNMQIVIDIPEKMYNEIVERENHSTVDSLILDGTPLPKGHGELIERNKIEYTKAIHDAKYGHISWSDAVKRIKYSAPTIIEADKTERE